MAVGLAWLDGDFPGQAPGGSATIDDVQSYLDDQEEDLLVRAVIEQAMGDERLRERLLLRATRADGLNRAAF